MQLDGKVLACGSAGQDGGYALAISRYTTGITVGIDEKGNAQLSAIVYPNPAVNRAAVRFEMESAGQLTIKIFDLTGKHLRTLQDEASLPKGEHTVSFDLEGIDTGLYLLEIKAGTYSRKLKLIKQ